jgi:hypothetical protein
MPPCTRPSASRTSVPAGVVTKLSDGAAGVPSWYQARIESIALL